MLQKFAKNKVLCPRDQTGLALKPYRGQEYFYFCGSCGGIWIQYKALEEFHSMANLEAMMKTNRLRSVFKPRIIHCPMDGTTTTRKMHTEVEINYCLACGGVWVDAKELQKIFRQTKEFSSSAKRLLDSSEDIILGPLFDTILNFLTFLH